MSKADEKEKNSRKFVEDLYFSILGRAPDSDGLDYHVRNLLSGQSNVDLIKNFLNSDEYTKKIKTRLDKRTEKTFIQLDKSKFPLDYTPIGEAARSYQDRVKSGFFDLYCNGDLVLDVGFTGYDNPEAKTAIPNAIGIDLDYPGYDGIRLPFDDNSVDTVMSSHCLEHILFDHMAIRDWFRVIKVGGFIVCTVPHQGLYEKKRFLPSNWNSDHKRMYTPASLLSSFEKALDINTYRVRHLADNDRGFDYTCGPEHHSTGCYEIELVIEKIIPPTWKLA